MKITVTHIGEDYGKVEATDSYGHTIEYEVPLSLAQALHTYLNIEEKRQAV